MRTAFLRGWFLVVVLAVVPGWAQSGAEERAVAGVTGSRLLPSLIVSSTLSPAKGMAIGRDRRSGASECVRGEGAGTREGDILIEASEGGWDRFLTVEVFLRKNRVTSPVQWPLRKVGSAPRTVKLTADAPYVLSTTSSCRRRRRRSLSPGSTSSWRSWVRRRVPPLKVGRECRDSARGALADRKSDGLPANEGCGFVLNFLRLSPRHWARQGGPPTTR